MEFPLSADVMVASFSWDFVFMERKALYSDWWWVLCVFGVVTSVLLDYLILVFGDNVCLRLATC
jgi:hypothetical protein